MPNKTRDQSPGLPSSVIVNFTSVWNDDGPVPSAVPVPYQITVPIASVLGAAVAGTGASSSLMGVPSTEKLFFETCQALFTTAGGTTTPTNNAALQTLANQIAQDYYSWRVLAWDRVIAGIVLHAQDGFTDTVEWSYGEGGVGGGPYTRAVAWVGDDDPEELMHSDAPPFIPTGQFYIVKTGGGGIGAAASATQWTSGTVTIQQESYTGAVTPMSGSPTWKCWNGDSTTGGIAANLIGGMTRVSPSGKYLFTYLPCGS